MIKKFIQWWRERRGAMMVSERDEKLIARVRELEEQRTERIIEAGYTAVINLPRESKDELRAVLQALWTRTFYRDQAKFK